MSRDTVMRLLLGLVFAVVVALGAFAVPTIWGRPWSPDHFYMRVFVAFLLRHPMVATGIGMELPFGGNSLDNLSPAFTRHEAAWVQQQLEMLRSYDTRRMTHDQKLSRDVMEFFLADQVDGQRFMFHDYIVNPFQGAQSELPDFFLNSHPLRKQRDARHYVARLERLGVALDQVTEGIRLRASTGIVPPRFVLDGVVLQIDSLTAPAAERNPLVLKLTAALDTLHDLESHKQADRLRARAVAAVREGIVPAFGRMRAVCDSLRATATDDAGVWKLPDGDAYYAWQLRHHTSTDLPADTVHALGLEEVARIRGTMSGLLRRVGHPGELRAAVTALEQDDRFHYPAEDASRDTILQHYRDILRDAEARTRELVGIWPKGELTVRRVPAFREAGSAAAYYQSPALDGSRPGTFYVNTRDPRETARFDMRTLAFHEGIPGHHLQQAIAGEAKDLPFFRRVIPFTAYAEGWALYAERLALERGFHPTAYDSIGSLRADLLRATRLVVDTGLHRKHWTREQAVAYMVDEGLQTESLARTEVDRYIVNPGQACAYKVGQLKILELRRRAMDRLGPKFDIRRFHDVVLRNGALPLVLLERVVDEWIASEAGPGPRS